MAHTRLSKAVHLLDLDKQILLKEAAAKYSCCDCGKSDPDPYVGVLVGGSEASHLCLYCPNCNPSSIERMAVSPLLSRDLVGFERINNSKV